MSEFQLIASFSINDGMLDQFKAVAKECLEIVRQKDTGTTQYDWHIDEARNKCVVREEFVDAEAFVEHVENLGPILGKLGELTTSTIELFGDSSEETIESLKDANPSVYRFFEGI